MASDRRRELRRGLARTRWYLLAHHRPADYDRCHTLRVGGRTVRLCARRSGVYPGIAVGLALVATGTANGPWPWLVALGPAPALLDWGVTTLGSRRGHNAVRTATGTLLGAGYALGAAWFLADAGARPWLLGAAVGYGTLATAGLWLARRRAG